MKSPFTGGEATLVISKSEMEFRKETFPYVSFCWRCCDTGEHFSTPEMEDAALQQVHNAYRAKYGIPSVEEIRVTREKYRLSRTAFSKLLGFGENMMKRYEEGEVPSVSNGKVLALLMKDPWSISSFLKQGDSKMCDHIARLDFPQDGKSRFVYGNGDKSIENGYGMCNFAKLEAVFDSIHTLPLELESFYRILFLADCISFARYGHTVTGLKYRKHYGKIYPEKIYAAIGLSKVVEAAPSSYIGIQLFPNMNSGDSSYVLSDEDEESIAQALKLDYDKVAREVLGSWHDDFGYLDFSLTACNPVVEFVFDKEKKN